MNDSNRLRWFDPDLPTNTGVVVGRLEDGRRFLANTPDDRALLEALTTREGVGQRGIVSPAGATNWFDAV